MPFIDLFIFTPVICEDWRRQLFARGKKKKKHRTCSFENLPKS